MGYLGAGWFHVVGGNHCGEPMSLEYRLDNGYNIRNLIGMTKLCCGWKSFVE